MREMPESAAKKGKRFRNSAIFARCACREGERERPGGEGYRGTSRVRNRPLP